MRSRQNNHQPQNLPDRIAIDGPAASGKSTIALLLADLLDYLYFDTGVMYRAVTLAGLRRFNSVNDETQITKLAREIVIDVLPPTRADGRKYDVLLDGEDVTHQLRTGQINQTVSIVSAYPGVREAMTLQQRAIARRGRVVMVGRDIGTVVIPDAELKIYLEASPEERARRRYEEERLLGRDVNYDEILASLRERDRIDSGRRYAPLKPAKDAVIVNTDALPIADVFAQVKSLLNIPARQ
jgi:cytidylate kinase